MPGILLRVNSSEQGGLKELTHDRDSFGTAEIGFENTYLGVVDFKHRLKDKSLFLPEQGLGIVICGDVYLDKETKASSGPDNGDSICTPYFEEYQSIFTNRAFDIESFGINGETYIAIANSYNGSSVYINSKSIFNASLQVFSLFCNLFPLKLNLFIFTFFESAIPM